MSFFKPFDAVTIAADSNETSEAIMLGYNHRKHSLYYAITGDGTATIEYLASANGEDFVLMATAIATSKTKITGEQSDGIHFEELDMIPCEAVKFRVTETGKASEIVITMILCYRLWD